WRRGVPPLRRWGQRPWLKRRARRSTPGGTQCFVSAWRPPWITSSAGNRRRSSRRPGCPSTRISRSRRMAAWMMAKIGSTHRRTASSSSCGCG
ncbi:MAG: hypothetical protein AVDCRST_MAG59-1693, partial [uncultured Thermomicrobiales bacterium]